VVESAECSEAKSGDEVPEACEEEDEEDIVGRGETKKDDCGGGVEGEKTTGGLIVQGGFHGSLYCWSSSCSGVEIFEEVWSVEVFVTHP